MVRIREIKLNISVAGSFIETFRSERPCFTIRIDKAEKVFVYIILLKGNLIGYLIGFNAKRGHKPSILNSGITDLCPCRSIFFFNFLSQRNNVKKIGPSNCCGVIFIRVNHETKPVVSRKDKTIIFSIIFNSVLKSIDGTFTSFIFHILERYKCYIVCCTPLILSRTHL